MFFLFVMLASPVGSAMLRIADEPHRVEVNLQNDEDVSMMATVRLGHQDMRCIMDSGSSEQLFFSSQCESCGSKMYNCDQDPACHWGEHQTSQSYGSGTAYSTEVHASMTITSQYGDSSIHQDWQMAWLVTAAEFDFKMNGNMQCIFGLGPASSAVEFAQMEVVQMQNYLKTAPDEKAVYAPLLENLTKHAHFMKDVTLWQEASKSKHFSYCLHPELGKDGRLIFNDPTPSQMPGAFQIVHTSLTNGRDLYWQLDMSDAKIEIPGQNAIAGCSEDGGCIAVMDTGTSLIGAPWSFMEPLNNFLTEYVSNWGCGHDVLHKYPDFTFTLGDQQFKLPPRAYVCQFDEDGSAWEDGDMSAKHRMPHLQGFKKMQENLMLDSLANSAERQDYFCAPCFFEMEDEGDKQQWLFGLPFFREYYTVFQTTPDFKNTDKMLFAQANPSCDVRAAKTMRGAPRNLTVQRIKTHKLRLPPTGARKHRARSQKTVR